MMPEKFIISMRPLFLIVCCFILAGCSRFEPEALTLGAPEFSGEPYRLIVGQIVLKESQAEQPRDVQQSHRFPTTLKEGLRNWLQNRVKANGTQGMLVADILHASVTERLIDDNAAWWGLVPASEELEYTANLHVLLSVIDPHGRTVSTIETMVTRQMQMPRSTGVLDQQEAFNKLILSTLQQMDANFEQQIPLYFQRYMVTYR